MREWSKDVATAAKEFRGNWQKFDSFIWFSRNIVIDPEAYAIVYLSNRDSDLIDKSNEAVILRALTPFMGEPGSSDCWTESHSHSLVGHIDGVVIRCLDAKGAPTEAFTVLHNLMRQKDDYPILDEDDYSRAEQAAEDEDWITNGRLDFRYAIEKYFDTSCTKYPDSALEWLHSILSDRYSDRAWSEDRGFDFEGKLKGYKSGDLRIALRQARDRSVCHHVSGMLREKTLVCSICGAAGPWERGKSIIQDWPAPRFDGKADPLP